MLRSCLSLRSWCHRPSITTSSSFSTSASGLLSDVRILDLTRVLAGPFCTQFLADLGADVIKLERPGAGDDTRAFGPPFFESKDGSGSRNASYFLAVNRNKQSIAVDLKRGTELVKQLASKSDVFIENFTPGVADKLGLGYQEIAKVNPRIIYCSISGFGSDSSRAGYDVIASSVAGLLSVTGPEDGEPCRPGVPVVDIITGMYASNAILSAIIKKQKDGSKAEAVKIEVDLISSQISILINLALNYLNFGVVTPRRGSAHDSIVPYQAFACKKVGPETDWITIGAGSDSMFHKLIRTLFSDDEAKCEEILRDDRFKRNCDRVEHRSELIGLIQGVFRKRTQEDWLKRFEGHGFSFGPVNRLDQVFSDPRIMRRNVMQVKDDKHSMHLLRNAVTYLNNSGNFLRSDVRLPAQRVGQDTAEVLRSVLGMNEEEIEQLKSSKVIDCP